MSELNSEMVNRLFEEQLSSWKQARDNYEALDRVMTREVNVDGFTFKIQFNPARIVSSAAKVDAKSIKERNCFLCKENRPAVQKGIDFSFDDKDHYTVLINPFPIFKRHLTIPLEEHRDQLIIGRFNVMLELARKLTDFTIFYNGPKCGASAPDHFHFQAGIKGFMPIESSPLNAKTFFSDSEITLEQVVSGLPGIIIMESSSGSKAEDFFDKLYSSLEIKEGEREPMLNILCSYEKDKWRIVFFLRKKHRPDAFFKEGDENILISPASVDLGGVLITPLEKDFVKLTAKDVSSILSEVLISYDELETIVKKLKLII
ncbi:MAG: DUF4922 domain-containing protein [Rikenellaceae bacterium]